MCVCVCVCNDSKIEENIIKEDEDWKRYRDDDMVFEKMKWYF